MIIMSLHLVNPGMKVTTMTPFFYSIFGLYYMYIFHLAKGQENLNSRSKMAHLPLWGINDLKLFFHLTTFCVFLLCTSCYVHHCTSLYVIVHHLYVICTSSVTFYLLG